MGSLPARVARGDGLRVVYQPVVDLRRLTVTGYEALARCDLPGAPGPHGLFSAAADEGPGTLADLDAACLRAALAGRPDLPPNCFLALNVEPRSAGSRPVGEVMADAGDLRGIVIEVTERGEADDPGALARVLEAWRGRGARLAVDDAGVGYSGLQKVLDMRPDIIKLDRALVQDVACDEAKAALVEMMGTFAGHIDAWLLAEGVESPSDALRLAGLGVPLAQGHLFAPPGAPWAALDEGVRRTLVGTRSGPRVALDDLLHPAPSVVGDVEQTPASVTARRGDDVVVIVDVHDGPVGVVVRSPADGALRPVARPLRVNVHTSPLEVAHRLSTRRPVDTSSPVIVTDDVGRYVGVVTVARLLGALASGPDHGAADRRGPAGPGSSDPDATRPGAAPRGAGAGG